MMEDDGSTEWSDVEILSAEIPHSQAERDQYEQTIESQTAADGKDGVKMEEEAGDEESDEEDDDGEEEDEEEEEGEEEEGGRDMIVSRAPDSKEKIYVELDSDSEPKTEQGIPPTTTTAAPIPVAPIGSSSAVTTTVTATPLAVPPVVIATAAGPSSPPPPLESPTDLPAPRSIQLPSTAAASTPTPMPAQQQKPQLLLYDDDDDRIHLNAADTSDEEDEKSVDDVKMDVDHQQQAKPPEQKQVTASVAPSSVAAVAPASVPAPVPAPPLPPTPAMNASPVKSSSSIGTRAGAAIAWTKTSPTSSPQPVPAAVTASSARSSSTVSSFPPRRSFSSSSSSLPALPMSVRRARQSMTEFCPLYSLDNDCRPTNAQGRLTPITKTQSRVLSVKTLIARAKQIFEDRCRLDRETEEAADRLAPGSAQLQKLWKKYEAAIDKLDKEDDYLNDAINETKAAIKKWRKQREKFDEIQEENERKEAAVARVQFEPDNQKATHNTADGVQNDDEDVLGSDEEDEEDEEEEGEDDEEEGEDDEDDEYDSDSESEASEDSADDGPSALHQSSTDAPPAGAAADASLPAFKGSEHIKRTVVKLEKEWEQRMYSWYDQQEAERRVRDAHQPSDAELPSLLSASSSLSHAQTQRPYQDEDQDVQEIVGENTSAVPAAAAAASATTPRGRRHSPSSITRAWAPSLSSAVSPALTSFNQPPPLNAIPRSTHAATATSAASVSASATSPPPLVMHAASSSPAMRPVHLPRAAAAAVSPSSASPRLASTRAPVHVAASDSIPPLLAMTPRIPQATVARTIVSSSAAALSTPSPSTAVSSASSTSIGSAVHVPSVRRRQPSSTVMATIPPGPFSGALPPPSNVTPARVIAAPIPLPASATMMRHGTTSASAILSSSAMPPLIPYNAPTNHATAHTASASSSSSSSSSSSVTTDSASHSPAARDVIVIDD